MMGLPGLRFAAWEVPHNPGAREVVGSNPTDPTILKRRLGHVSCSFRAKGPQFLLLPFAWESHFESRFKTTVIVF